MPPITTSELNLVKNTLLAEAENVARELIGNISRLRSQGIGQAQIRERVLTDLDAGQGGLQRLYGQVKQRMGELQSRFYTNGQEKVLEKFPDKLFLWNAVGSDTCPDCVGRAGRVKTLERWKGFGLPASGSTVCKHNCRCTLIPLSRAIKLYRVDTSQVTSEAELIKATEFKARRGIRKRIRELKKLNRERRKEKGTGFAKSTLQAKLGDFRERGADQVLDPRSSTLARNRAERKRKKLQR